MLQLKPKLTLRLRLIMRVRLNLELSLGKILEAVVAYVHPKPLLVTAGPQRVPTWMAARLHHWIRHDEIACMFGQYAVAPVSTGAPQDDSRVGHR